MGRGGRWTKRDLRILPVSDSIPSEVQLPSVLGIMRYTLIDLIATF